MFDTIWYDNLIKPAFNPPAWIFSPVWIILYGTLLVSLILYSIKVSNNKFQGYILFVVHMIFNLIWSPVFFILHKIDIALFIIFFMILTGLLTVKKFYTISKISAFILIPYLCWLVFAAYLNFELFRLN